MAQFLSVFAASGAVPTAADLRSVAEDSWYGDDDLSFGPGAGRGGILTVRLPDARRAIAVSVETDPARVAVMVDEQLDERDAVPPGVVEQLRRTRQVVSLEFDPDSFDDDGWELLEVLQSWLARELEGLVVVDDGIYDSRLHLLAPPSSGGLAPTPEVLADVETLRDEGVRRGLSYGLDFAIASVPAAMSSELVLLTVDEAGFVLYYRDMGQNRELARGAAVGDVAERFLDEAARLAGPRGRGPYAGQEPPYEFEGMTREQVIEEYRRRGFAI